MLSPIIYRLSESRQIRIAFLSTGALKHLSCAIKGCLQCKSPGHAALAVSGVRIFKLVANIVSSISRPVMVFVQVWRVCSFCYFATLIRNRTCGLDFGWVTPASFYWDYESYHLEMSCLLEGWVSAGARPGGDLGHSWLTSQLVVYPYCSSGSKNFTLELPAGGSADVTQPVWKGTRLLVRGAQRRGQTPERIARPLCRASEVKWRLLGRQKCCSLSRTEKPRPFTGGLTRSRPYTLALGTIQCYSGILICSFGGGFIYFSYYDGRVVLESRLWLGAGSFSQGRAK